MGASQKVYAVIDIGINFVKMQISQLTKGQLCLLEKLEYPVNLGHDVFDEGTIRFDHICALTEVLTKYQTCLAVYPECCCRVISCSAMRQAKNRKIIADMIENQLGLSMEVLEEPDEKSRLFYEVMRSLKENKTSFHDPCLLSYIGTGSIGLAILEGKQITQSQNLPTGALKTHENLQMMRRETENFHEVLSDYIRLLFSNLEQSDSLPGQIILTGPEIALLVKLTHGETHGAVYTIHAPSLFRLQRALQDQTMTQIARRYDILEDEATMLYYTIFLAIGLIEAEGVERLMILPEVDISVGMMKSMSNPRYEKEYMAFRRRGALSCVTEIASQWNRNEEAETPPLMEISSQVYKRLYRLHGMDPGDIAILKAACFLVNPRPFWSYGHNPKATFDLIRNIEIFGLSQDEITILAMVCAYIESPMELLKSEALDTVQESLKMPILKFTAIGSIAFSLCNPTKNLYDIKISFSEKHRRVLFTGSTDQGALLEKWRFQQCVEFFENIFGILPELQIKLNFLS